MSRVVKLPSVTEVFSGSRITGDFLVVFLKFFSREYLLVWKCKTFKNLNWKQHALWHALFRSCGRCGAVGRAGAGSGASTCELSKWHRTSPPQVLA